MGAQCCFGVSASGKPQATANDARFDGSLSAAVQAAALLASPPLMLPPPYIVPLDDQRVVRRRSAARNAPRVPCLNGRYLTRTGASNRLLSPPELTALLLSRDEAGFEARPAPGASLRDLDLGAVEAYVDEPAAMLPARAGERTLLSPAGA